MSSVIKESVSDVAILARRHLQRKLQAWDDKVWWDDLINCPERHIDCF